MTIWRKLLWRDTPDPNREPPSVGPDKRVYAIGDIHGRADLMDDVLMRIAQDDADRPAAQRHLVFLGDFVDRGPSSRQVIDRAMALAASCGIVHCLKGNHEEVFVEAARGDPRVIPLFRRMGGGETLASYGLDIGTFASLADDEVTDWMLNHVPRDHVDFVDRFADTVEIGDYLFVHAGIRPRVGLSSQSGSDMRWIRHEFLNHGGLHPRMIVHGHSITDEIDEQDNRIGIDTGAYFSGRLTAIGLEGAARWFIQTAA